MALVASSLSFTALPTFAQTSASPSQAACKIDKSAPTDADIAFFRQDFKKAETLYAAAYAKDPSDSHSRELQIDSLLGQGKLDDARKLADAWTASETKDPFAILAAADVRHTEGDWLEAYALDLKALKINPCLAEGYDSLGDYESLAGFRAAAHKHYTLAHQLSPNNENFRLDWIEGLGEAEEIQAAKDYLHDSKSIDEKSRKTAEDEYARRAARAAKRCELGSVNGPARIPMTPIYGPTVGVKAWGLEIAFNGKKRTLQIDTGASGFTLTQSEGANLNLPRVDIGRVGGIGSEGSTGVDIAYADSVRIGGLEFQSCPVEILHKTGAMGGSTMMGERLDDIDGLVGSDIFSRYLVTLDYIHHEVRLDPLPQPPGATVPAAQLDALGGRTDPDWMKVDRYIAPTMQSWTKVYRRGHELIMPTYISNGEKRGVPRLFMIDTGADSNLIDIGTAKEITHASENTMTSIGGLSGKEDKVFEAGKFTLDFAGLRLPVRSMDAIDLSKFNGVLGFLGYPTLEQLVMHIDYRDNLVLFEAPGVKK